MGIPTTIGRFAVKEQASSWGTPETSFANANYLEAQIAVLTPAQASVQAEVMRASWFATTRLDGGKGPTELSLTTPLHGFSTAAPTDHPTEHPDALLLRSVLGANVLGGYATDVAGGRPSAGLPSCRPWPHRAITLLVGSRPRLRTSTPCSASGH